MSRPNTNPNPNPNPNPTRALTLENLFQHRRKHPDFNVFQKTTAKKGKKKYDIFSLKFVWRRARVSRRKTLKSGCLSLLTIRSFGARDGLGLTVRVWLGFGLSILYQMPFSLLKLAVWLRGYSRLKKVGLSRLTHL
eukprot:sb/3474614/